VGDFADLALKVKDAGIRSVVFRRLGDQAGVPGLRQDPQPGRGLPAPAGARCVQRTDGDHGSTPTSTAGSSAASAPSSPAVSATDACAYDPVAAQKALDAGEPPTKSHR
jgi:hypothetical protein